ncbi:MAG TPA: hypothetical protein VF594_03720, partial [Rubricoccaceae bacterium]
DALGTASQVRIDQSLGRIDRAVERLAETEEAPQTFFAWLRDGFARRRARPRPDRPAGTHRDADRLTHSLPALPPDPARHDAP